LKAEGQRLLPGFPDPVFDSQRVFRSVLRAVSHPGRVFALQPEMKVPAPLYLASAAVVLALLDFETPLWTDLPNDSPSVTWLRFHCSCPLAENPGGAKFALICGAMDLGLWDRFARGTDQCPEDSATLIIQTRGLVEGRGRKLTGPGIEKENYLEVQGLPEDFWPAWRINHAAYPLGVDVILAAGSKIAALPRTTRAE
jgi:alpha-D-ribose 1-methylphosphonate 5-triphosphate synthase subunit PhnH